jgi:hypothetical protein
MELEFSALSDEERVARCHALAQAELDRANACADATRRQLHLSLAECWRTMARQFETLGSIRTGTQGKDLRSDAQAHSASQRFDAPFGGRNPRFAT